MYKLAIISLWSCSTQASLGTMTTISPEYNKTRDQTVIQNMPRIRSQDSLDICFGMSSAVIAQFYICKQKNIQCSSLAENKEISPLAMVGWANTNSDDSLGGRDSDHSNLNFLGRGGKALQYLASEPNNDVLPEACYPLDQLANEYGLTSSKETKDTLDRIESEYKNYKNTEASFCETCLIDDLQKLKVKTYAEEIKQSLVLDSFSQFLHSAFFASCDKMPLGFEPPPQHNTFPRGNTATYKETMSKIKEVLKKGYPLVLDGVCGSFDGNGNCVGHSVAINGYRKICKADGTCRESLKIQNSWGIDWQKQNDDGWLDAKTLFGEDPIQEFAISWWLPKS